MPLQIRNVQVWSGEVPDRVGAAVATLERLALVGADLEFVITRSFLDRAEGSKIYLAPISDAQQMQVARECGLSPDSDIIMLRVEGDNRPGIGFEIMSRLAVAGINLRGLSVSAVDRRFAAYLAFDDADAATLAVQVLATIDS